MELLLALVLGQQLDDAFIQGYATSILERELSLRPSEVTVRDGVVTLREDELGAVPKEKVVSVLGRIRGVREVRFEPGGARLRTPEPATGGGWSLFPDGRVFAPLVADPRWPRFGLSALSFTRSGVPQLGWVAAASLGESFEIVGWESESLGRFSLGLQPGVFALFDLEAESLDLVNADYRLGLPLDWRAGIVSAELRVLHQSSHLGDEFLLENPGITRINLSYETVELLVSVEPSPLRVYAGAGRVFHSEPDLDPWTLQGGAELVLPAWFGDAVSPLVAVDLKSREETGWSPDFSLRAGVEFTSPAKQRRRVQLLIEYFRGRNPNGQFYEERVEYVGAGFHVHF
jgi:hypothetical protein